MTVPADVDGELEDLDAGPNALRIDKWLWYTRLVKSRTLATALITGGHVHLNRSKVDKPSQLLRLGDVVTATVSRRVRVLKVVAFGQRRGPAAEAAALYEDLTPAPAASSSVAVGRADGLPAPGARRQAGSGRPTKRDRRRIDRLRTAGYEEE
ncbi:MAG: RNA-binding S4 domain-containing protein [Hyphomicrobiaceae bacterium]|nr:RNA-binding S4 domain-containing protein [Hyphomicrobiaceae bacterium]